MILKIAVLLTCHNRKSKTISCLRHLFDVFENGHKNFEIDVYLTDDGSIDNTKEEILIIFPQVKVLEGTGNMYWAGGMRNSWREAMKLNYDAYMLLNDDTVVATNVFEELLSCDEYSKKIYNKSGVYIGSTHDGENNFTYGGSVVTSNFFFKYRRLIPCGKIEECDLGNGNIMLVTNDVVKKIGIFSEDYTHGIADYDYTLTARKNLIPVLISANYCGVCADDTPSQYKKFKKLSYKARKKYINHPTGLAFSDQVKFMRKFYPFRLPFIYLAALIKLVLPNIYIEIDKFR